MLTLLAFSRSGVPIRQQHGASVSTGDIAKVGFVGVHRFVGDGTGHGLNDVFAFDLEEYVVGGERSHRLRYVSD